jgi:hypothetical protein
MGTSLFNTLDNALISYIAYRHTCTPEESYNKLGMYGGDDGVNFDINMPHLTRVADRFGLKIKCEMINKHQVIPFLGRVYVDLWTTPNSIIDVKRQLAKFHLTSTPSVVPEEVILKRRCEALLVTDPHTMLISHLCRAILKFVNNIEASKYDHMLKDTNWFAQYESPFDTPPMDDELTTRYIASSFSMSIYEVYDIIISIEKAKSLKELRAIRLTMPNVPEIELTACMGDTLYHPPQKSLQKAKRPIPGARATGLH